MAVLYLDSSAIIKLYAVEEHSPYTLDLVHGAGIPTAAYREAEEDAERQSRILDARAENVVAVSAIAWVECCAAFAAKERVRALTSHQRLRAEEALARDMREAFLVRPVSGSVLRLAAALSAPRALRAYDAVQLASALALREDIESIETATERPEGDTDRVLMVSFDRDLHDAAVAEGVAHSRPGRGGGRTFPVPG